MKFFTNSFNNPRGLLLNIIACEIIGAICLIALVAAQFNIPALVEVATYDQIKMGAISLCVLSILFTVVATRLLRARLDKIRIAPVE